MFSIETRLAAADDSKIFWQIGAFYEKDDIERNQVGTLLLPVAGRDLAETIITDNVTNSYALFGEVTVPLGEKTNITGGLRWSRDEKVFGATAIHDGPGRVFVRTTYTDLEATNKWERVTWRFTLDRHFTEDIYGFATVSTGFKSGGYQDTPANPVDAVTAFNPENVTNYEVGLKMDWSWVRANISVFQMDLNNQQVRTTDTDTGATVTSNAGKSKIQGVELELTLRPTDYFTLGVNYAYLDAKFVEFIDDGDDFSGNRISKSPQNAFTVSANYYLENIFGADGELNLGVDYAWTGQVFGDNTNDEPEIFNSYGLLDARGVYTTADNQWDISLWVNNLTDKEYAIHMPDFGIASWRTFGPPRTYGATISWHY